MQAEDNEKITLNGIVGKQLGEVAFVQDYVQLHFDGPRLTAVTCPDVTTSEGIYRWNQPGYRDALCSLIAHIVIAARVIPGTAIEIEFDNSAVISVSLKDEDYRAAEAAIFDGDNGTWIF